MPIYGISDTYVGRGVVGGRVFSLETQGQRAARLAVRILSGEKLGTISGKERNDNTALFDWRQLRRWGIDEDRLPEGSTISNRQFSLWDLYHWHIIGGGSLCVAETFLIAGLFIQLKRRKQAEENCREGERRLTDAQRAARIGSWERDLKSNELMWSAETYRLFGQSPSDTGLTYPVFRSIIAPEDLPSIQRSIDQAIATRTPFTYQYHIGAPGGSRRIMEERGEVVVDATGQPLRLVGTVQDITERKQADDDLRSRQEILQTIFAHVPVMIVFTDERGRIVMANHCFETTTGWPLEEAKVRDMIAELYPDPEESERVFRFMRQPRPGGWDDFQLKTRSGALIETSWSNVMLADGTSLGIGIDVTERRRAEAERETLHQEVTDNKQMLEILSRRLIETQEAERQHLAHELHDALGQTLTAIHLHLAAFRLTAKPEALPSLDECEQIVHQAIEQVRGLSLDLRPALLDILGLEDALRAYLIRHADQGGLDVKFDSDFAGVRMSSALETSCFRVVQAALTNTIRHAAARSFEVKLGTSKGTLELIIRDDGRGFDMAAARRGTIAGRGFGLLSMRERVELFGGKFVLESSEGRGTTIRVQFPLEDKPS
jgi:PAS domain S-box-containing protein